MSPISLGEAVVEVGADTTRFKGQLSKGIEGAAAGAKGSLGRIPATAGKAGHDAGESFAHRFKHGVKDLAISGGSLIGLVGLEEGLKTVVEKATDVQKTGRLTEQVIKSTGGAAHVSAKHVDELSRAIEHKSVVDHMQVQSGENMLLTFKNIRNESGKGNKIYDQATQAIVDMNAAMAAAGRGGAVSIKSEAIQLGKALNDPVKGLTALTRVGVTFTAEQKKQIKTLVDTGHRMQAQKIILRELKSEFGGAAKAQATDAARAKLAINDLEEEIGKKLLPVVNKLAIWTTTKAVPAISKFIDEMHTGEGAGGAVAKDLTLLLDAGRGVIDMFNGLPGPIKKYGVELLIGMAVMSKFTGGIGRMAGMFTLSAAQIEAGVTRQQLAMTRLKGAAVNLAGAGGMLLIADSANRTSKTMGLLEKTAGGALAGGALGAFAGPEGALAGAAIGALATGGWGLVQAMKETSTATNGAKTSVKDYTDTLNIGSNAISGYTRSLVAKKAQESGAVDQGRILGLSSKTVVNAMLGQKGAIDKVTAAQAKADALSAGSTKITYDKYGNVKTATDTATAAQKRFIKAAGELGTTVRGNQAVLTADIIKTNELALSMGKYAKVLPGIPKNVATRVDQIGLEKAVGNIVRLTAKYHLTPPQVRTVLAAANVKPTEAQINAIIAQAKVLGAQHPTVHVNADTAGAKAKVSALVSDIHSLLSGNFTALITTRTVGGGKKPKTAVGGVFTGAQTRVIAEAGREAVVPLDRNLSSVDPSVRYLSAIAQGKAIPLPARDTHSTTGTVATSQQVQLIIQNPVPETTTQSLPRALSTLAFVVGAS